MGSPSTLGVVTETGGFCLLVNQRISHAQKKDKNQGRQTINDRKERLSWQIMITNIEEVLKADIMFDLYRLR